MLQACLESLAALEKTAGDRIRIVVVENDVEPRSLDVVNDIRRTAEIEVLYVREPRRGIPVARNAGIRCATALNADWIALIDDDETANPDWLKALYDACRKFSADIASGPVRHKYEVSPPHWWSGPTSRNWPTGQELKGAHTNNILMKAHLVAESGMGMRFDERLLAGSEDVEFFERAVQIGARIVWAANAGVSEAVPLSRVAPMRLLSREYMVATSQAQVCRIQRGALVGFLGTLPKIIRRAFTGSLFLIATPVAWIIKPSAGEHLFFSGAFRLAKAAGNLVGGLGIRSRYYMSTDGR
jgi:succinoglycan biosynthesis protein ExoM